MSRTHLTQHRQQVLSSNLVCDICGRSVMQVVRSQVHLLSCEVMKVNLSYKGDCVGKFYLHISRKSLSVLNVTEYYYKKPGQPGPAFYSLILFKSTQNQKSLLNPQRSPSRGVSPEGVQLYFEMEKRRITK